MKEDNQYQPLGDIVLIRVDQPVTETDSGILVKEDWKTLPPTGLVLAAGPEVPAELVGKQVVFERYSSVTLEGDLRLCKLAHVLATKS